MPSKHPQMTLRQARERAALTQEELEAATAQIGQKIDQRQISRLERGDIADPRNSTVAALERALRLRRGTLIFGKRRPGVAA